jgi:3-methyladenine DNA glycosylase/8-oxoguanine DNA glycosylase
LGAATARVELTPPSAFRLPRFIGRDGVTRRRPGGLLERVLHRGGEAVIVRVAQPSPDRVVIGAWAADRRAAAYAVERTRFALGVDEDHGAFRRAFARDPLIGASVRRRPWLRPPRRPDPFEVLAWAICEQLIDYDRAAAIERRIVVRLGRRCPRTGLRDLPTAGALAGTAPALLESLDLSASRALTLVRAAREIARGRIDLAGEPEQAERRLAAIPGIGPWTLDILAVSGFGRLDRVPAGDLHYLKVVGRLLSGGDPAARASEQQVRELLAPYGPWAALAATHLL